MLADVGLLRTMVDGDNRGDEQEIPSSPGIRGCLRTAWGQTSVVKVTVSNRNNRALSGVVEDIAL